VKRSKNKNKNFHANNAGSADENRRRLDGQSASHQNLKKNEL